MFYQDIGKKNNQLSIAINAVKIGLKWIGANNTGIK
jgi:hypothetical protein